MNSWRRFLPNSSIDLASLKDHIQEPWNFQWITTEPSLSHQDKSNILTIQNLPEQESFLWLVDGIVHINISESANESESESEAKEENYILNTNHGMIIPADCHYTITTRSGWAAQILLVKKETKETEDAKNKTETKITKISQDQIYPVGAWNVWRGFSKQVREVLSLDHLSLVVGPENLTWFGSRYLANANFRVIQINLPEYNHELRLYPEIGWLPSWRYLGEDLLYFVGIEGLLQINIDGYRDWLGSGKIMTVKKGQTVCFTSRGNEATRVMVFSSLTEGLLAKQFIVDDHIWEVLQDIQSTVWSYLTSSCLNRSGITFGPIDKIPR